MGVHGVPLRGLSVPTGAMRLLERASFARNSRIVTAMAPHGPVWAPAQLARNSPGFGLCFASSA